MATESQRLKLRKALKGQRIEEKAICNVCHIERTILVDIDKNNARCKTCDTSMEIPNSTWDDLIKQMKQFGIAI